MRCISTAATAMADSALSESSSMTVNLTRVPIIKRVSRVSEGEEQAEKSSNRATARNRNMALFLPELERWESTEQTVLSKPVGFDLHFAPTGVYDTVDLYDLPKLLKYPIIPLKYSAISVVPAIVGRNG